MSRFEEIKIGDKAEIQHVLTKDDVEKFVALTGDDNKIHTNKDYASKTIFKKPVVHGMLGASFISTIIGTKLPGDGALWFGQSLEFLMPVRVGDKLFVKAEVIKKIKKMNVIELQTDIYNQNKQKVTKGVAKIRIIEQKVHKKVEKKHSKRVALVIGGTGGIGRATCLQLAKDGFDLAIHYHNNYELSIQIKKEIEKYERNSIIVKADIMNDIQLKEMTEYIIRKFQAITVLVNCSTAKIPNIKYKSLEWEYIKKHFELNIKGFYNLLKYIVPIMEQENYGKIISITTQYIETPVSGMLSYITAKSALYGFSKALALELAPKGIMVNMVSPGMTDTELISDIPEKVRLLTAAKTPLKRIARPEDVASAISYLASDKSNFITGETIRVNGGQVMI